MQAWSAVQACVFRVLVCVLVGNSGRPLRSSSSAAGGLSVSCVVVLPSAVLAAAVRGSLQRLLRNESGTIITHFKTTFNDGSTRKVKTKRGSTADQDNIPPPAGSAPMSPFGQDPRPASLSLRPTAALSLRVACYSCVVACIVGRGPDPAELRGIVLRQRAWLQPNQSSRCAVDHPPTQLKRLLATQGQQTTHTTDTGTQGDRTALRTVTERAIHSAAAA